MTLADLNGDGYPDIVAANRGDYPDLVDGKLGKARQIPTPSYVCLNDGKGHFPACEARSRQNRQRPSWRRISTAMARSTYSCLIAMVARASCFGMNGKGHFPTSTKVGAAEAWIRMGAAGDLDRDGRPDLAFIDERLNSTLRHV